MNPDPLREALSPSVFRAAEEMGVLRVESQRAIPIVKLTPYGGLLVASDHRWSSGSLERPQVVMGISPSTHALARVTVRRPVRFSLDLCTGTGVQALLAARHSERVVAVDVNPRALDFARFNAELNGIENVEFLECDLFETPRARGFDLVVCNPPFSISPESACLFRDNPMEGDAFARRIVEAIPAYLRTGGYGQVMCHWIEPREKSWFHGLGQWAQGSSCDRWVVRSSSLSPEEYAKLWLIGYADGETEAVRRRGWLDYYDRLCVAAIGSGIISLRRRRSREHWLRFDGSQPDVAGAAGNQVDLGFRLQDYLGACDDATLREEHFRIAEGVSLDRKAVAARGAWQSQAPRLRLGRGMRYVAPVHPRLLPVLLRCDGSRSLHAALEQAGRTDPALLEDPTVLPAVRKLITMGFLLPHAGGATA